MVDFAMDFETIFYLNNIIGSGCEGRKFIENVMVERERLMSLRGRIGKNNFDTIDFYLKE